METFDIVLQGSNAFRGVYEAAEQQVFVGPHQFLFPEFIRIKDILYSKYVRALCPVDGKLLALVYSDSEMPLQVFISSRHISDELCYDHTQSDPRYPRS